MPGLRKLSKALGCAQPALDLDSQREMYNCPPPFGCICLSNVLPAVLTMKKYTGVGGWVGGGGLGVGVGGSDIIALSITCLCWTQHETGRKRGFILLFHYFSGLEKEAVALDPGTQG